MIQLNVADAILLILKRGTTDMPDIKAEFTQALLRAYQRAKTEAKYPANVFYRMLNDHGGVDTAKRLINAPNQSDGYAELYLRNRLDLTVEAIVVDNPRWHALFTPEEIEKARVRLRANKYKIGSATESESPKRGSSSNAQMKNQVKKGEFTYGGRKLEVHAKKSASGHTWSVQVLEADKPANGLIYTVTTEMLTDAQQCGLDVIAELAARAEADFKTWAARIKRP